MSGVARDRFDEKLDEMERMEEEKAARFDINAVLIDPRKPRVHVIQTGAMKGARIKYRLFGAAEWLEMTMGATDQRKMMAVTIYNAIRDFYPDVTLEKVEQMEPALFSELGTLLTREMGFTQTPAP